MRYSQVRVLRRLLVVGPGSIDTVRCAHTHAHARTHDAHTYLYVIYTVGQKKGISYRHLVKRHRKPKAAKPKTLVHYFFDVMSAAILLALSAASLPTAVSGTGIYPDHEERTSLRERGVESRMLQSVNPAPSYPPLLPGMEVAKGWSMTETLVLIITFCVVGGGIVIWVLVVAHSRRREAKMQEAAKAYKRAETVRRHATRGMPPRIASDGGPLPGRSSDNIMTPVRV